MSANYEARQTYSETELLGQLTQYLGRSWLKRDKTLFNSSSAAITDNTIHFSGLMESKTHVLDVTSEHAAIVNAVSCKDPHIREMISMVDAAVGEVQLNPIVMKVLADHVRRTGTPLAYKVYDTKGTVLYSCEDVMETYYKPEMAVLEKIKEWVPKHNKVTVDLTKDIKQQLFECAMKGLETHFTSSTKTCYGAAVLAGGVIYFGGVYSSFDRRLNLHSEMVAALSAFADGKTDITHIGLVCTKFVDEAPQMCGCCRQFFSEVQLKTKRPITFYGFSYDGTKEFSMPLSEYLPHAWDSK